MTRRLLLFVLVMVVTFCAGLYTGIRLYYALLFGQVVLLLFALASVYYTVFKFNYLQSFSPLIVKKGETVQLNMQLFNDHVFPFPHLTVVYDTLDTLFSGGEVRKELDLAPHEKVDVGEEMVCRYRGQYTVGLRRIVAQDAMRLVRVDYDMTKLYYYKPCELVIYPRIAELGALPFPMVEMDGQSRQSPKASNELTTPFDTRAYQQGDPLKTIHWKLSARKRELVTKQYDIPMRPHTLLYIDAAAHGFEGLTAVELEDMACETATAICRCVLAHMLPLEMIFYNEGRQSVAGATLHDFASFHAALAYMIFHDREKMADVLAQEQALLARAGGILLVTCRMDEALFNRLILLSGSGITATVFFITPAVDPDSKASHALLELRRYGVKSVQITPRDSVEQKAGELL